MTSLNNRVRVDIDSQGLTTTQQQNARTNIGALAASDVGNTDRNFANDFTTALA